MIICTYLTILARKLTHKKVYVYQNWPKSDQEEKQEVIEELVAVANRNVVMT